VTALHNHLIGERPRILYLHVAAMGTPEAVSRDLRAVFAATHTPLGREAPEERPRADWSAVDQVLGPHAEAEGQVAEYVFPRREPLRLHGIAIRSTGSVETATEAVFQTLPRGRVACTGEMLVKPEEIDGVVRALVEHELQVTAVHNHTVDESPRMYWIHWYGTSGDAATLARGIAAALARTNSVPRSRSED
jgi:hypothetical protein